MRTRQIFALLSLPILALAACAPVATGARVASLSHSPPESRLLMPVEGVRVAEVPDSWGAPRASGRRHEGQDIFAPRGTPVRSAAPGIVTSLDGSTRGGRVVWITGAGGMRYYYAHLDRIAATLRVGDPVDSDTLLGFVGNSGNASSAPPHLHFAIYGPDGPLDPLPLLADR